MPFCSYWACVMKHRCHQLSWEGWKWPPKPNVNRSLELLYADDVWSETQGNLLLIRVSAKASGSHLAHLKEKGCMNIMCISNLWMQQLHAFTFLSFIVGAFCASRTFAFTCSARKLSVNKRNKFCLYFRKYHFNSFFARSQILITALSRFWILILIYQNSHLDWN